VKYLLDTNVVSELRKGQAAAPTVAAWVRPLDTADLAMSVLVLGEIRHGIELLRRRGDDTQAEVFAAWLDRLAAEFADRLLSVSRGVAERWGTLRGIAPLPAIDGLMAATAMEYDMTLVTRDTGALARVGVRVLDPWDV
jgi:predicted nucleic acid-binding protein